MASPPSEQLKKILATYNQGQFRSAINQARLVLNNYPNIALLHNVIANSLLQLDDKPNAVIALQKLLKVQPKNADAWNNLGMTQLGLNNPAKAEAAFENALKSNPNHIQALANLSKLLEKSGKLESPKTFYDKILNSDPNNYAALNALGGYYEREGDLEKSLANFKRAIEIKPDFASAYCNIGVVFAKLKQHDEAISFFKKSLELDANSAIAHSNLGAAYVSQHLLEPAREYLQKALLLNPNDITAQNNLGTLLYRQHDFEAAQRAFELALKIDPNSGKALAGIVHVFIRTEQNSRAQDYAQNALKRIPQNIDLLDALATAQKNLKMDEAFVKSLEKANELDPTDEDRVSSLMKGLLVLCDWKKLATFKGRLVDIGLGLQPIQVFRILSLDDDPKRIFDRTIKQIEIPQKNANQISFSHKRADKSKLRIGFFSADFKMHPVAFLILELLKRIDRNKFEVNTIELIPLPQDPIYQEIKRASDKQISIAGKTEKESIDFLREANFDIAIDLSGYTRGNRSTVFMNRIAPVQISYLGYPATTAMDAMDYVIADKTIIPEENIPFYSESPIYLPNTYMPTSNAQRVNEEMTRQSQGLPEDAFVFACFNNSYKITPDEFDIWMRLLKSVKGSVLWITKAPTAAMKNLKAEAKDRGVNPNRIIFSNREELVEDHLGRLACADLFLDCFNYNAHSTAVDALWAGLPILTREGRSFASRVAASLLRAIEMPQLIAQTKEEYENLALTLATEPTTLAALRDELGSKRKTAPLFNTEEYTRYFETALEMTYKNYQEGKEPTILEVPK